MPSPGQLPAHPSSSGQPVPRAWAPPPLLIAACVSALSIALLFTAFHRPSDDTAEASASGAAAPTLVASLPPTTAHVAPGVVAAIGDAERNPRHVALDAVRQPDAVLAFARVGEGMAVLEWGGGDGYYTELLARAVGPAGRVYVSQLEATARARKLRNVVPVSDSLDELADGSVDIAFSHANYHTRLRPGTDRHAHLQAAHRVLQLGGMLVVIDHAAAPGAGVPDAMQRQRVDERVVMQDAGRRGFLFEEASDVLRNAADDLERPASDPALRGAADRFALRFVRVGALDMETATASATLAGAPGS